MICRALDAGVPAAWVSGDEVYGNSPKLRAELEARQVGYATLHAQPSGNRVHRLRWSAWRRHHQARGCTCHYQRQAVHHR